MSKIRPRQGLCKDPKFNPFYSHSILSFGEYLLIPRYCQGFWGFMRNKVGKVPFLFYFLKYPFTNNFLFSVALCNLQDLSLDQ